jgi:hypothetical protein
MNSNNVEIHTLWIGTLGPLECLCLSSWVRLGYKVILHTYDTMPAPNGIFLYNAENLMPRKSIFTCAANNNIAVFSDVYRAAILNAFPNAIWLDADIFLLKHIDFSAENILAMENGDAIEHINSAVMRLQPNHPILNKILKRYNRPYLGVPWKKPKKAWRVITRAMASGGIRPQHLPWGALGYGAIHDHVSKCGFDGKILPSRICLTGKDVPIFSAIDNADAWINKASYIHMYRSGLKINLLQPAQDSIYERLCNLTNSTSAVNSILQQ